MKKRKQDMRKINFVLIIAAVVLLALVLAIYRGPVETVGYATDTVNLSATITTTVSCSASPSSLSFGTLTLGSDKTTTSGTVIDAASSNAPTSLTASVTSAGSWLTGFQSANLAWGILCPVAAGTTASGLTDSAGYNRHEFSPSSNTCRNPLGISGVTVGLGTGTISTLSQKTDSQTIFSRIKAPTGTTPGSFSSTITFTCTEITGPAAGLSFEGADFEAPGVDDSVLCDGSATNVYVAQAGLGAAPASIDDTVLSALFVCDVTGKCVAGTLSQEIGPTCSNAVGGGPPDEASTPNGADVVCGTFTCPASTLASGAGQIFIETGPLLSPSGEMVQSYFNVTIL